MYIICATFMHVHVSQLCHSVAISQVHQLYKWQSLVCMYTVHIMSVSILEKH